MVNAYPGTKSETTDTAKATPTATAPALYSASKLGETWSPGVVRVTARDV